MSALFPRSARFLSFFLSMTFMLPLGMFAQEKLPKKMDPKVLSTSKMPPIKTQEQYATYWTSEPGWDTELQLKNNLPSAPLTVTPVLRLASGEEVTLTPVTVPASASVSVSVNDGLRQHAPAMLSQAGSYGSIVFRFESFSAMNLHAMAVPAIQGVPVTFRIPAHAPSRPSDSFQPISAGGFEGIWWQPRPGLKDFLVVSNNSGSAVGATVSLFDASGKSWREPLSVGSHQTERLAMKDLLNTAGLGGTYGGIRLESASVSALDVVHLVYEENGKFSASLEMFSRDPNSTVLQRTGTDRKEWTIRAPMLALVSPDPALGLSSHTKLNPTVLVRNTTSRSISATMTLTWRGDSNKGVVKLLPSHFAPFETMQFQIWAAQKQLGIPDDAHWAMVSLTTDGSPEDLIAVASSWDCDSTYNVETKFTGGQGIHFAGGEWRTDATHNQLAAITNVGTHAAGALLTLHYNQGTKKYELQETIPPGGQMWVNLAQLARQQVPDRHGNYLPANVPAVTYEVQDQTPASHSLMVNDLAVNTALGQAVPACPTCCGFSAYYFSPSPVQVFIDGFEDVSVEAVNACTYQVSNIDPDMTDWFSSDAGIAAVTPEEVQGASVGTATAFAEGTVEVWGGVCGCHWEPIEPSAPVTVTPSVLFAPISYVIVGQTATTIATVTPANNSMPITLSISSPAAVVSPAGPFTTNTGAVVKGLTAGTATLTATVPTPEGGSPIPVGSTSFPVTSAAPTAVVTQRISGTVSTDDAALAAYRTDVGTTSLGPFVTTTGATEVGCLVGNESIATISPSSYTGTVILHRLLIAGYAYENSILYGTPEINVDDTSGASLRDDNPQSGGSAGKVYALDAPGETPQYVDGNTYRFRANFAADAELPDGTRISPYYYYYVRVSCKKTSTGFQFVNDVVGDNAIGPGTTATTWNLQ